jgi:hypothetical protein
MSWVRLLSARRSKQIAFVKRSVCDRRRSAGTLRGLTARTGASACNGRRIMRSKLDNIVLDAFDERLLVPERLRDLLSGWLDHSFSAA